MSHQPNYIQIVSLTPDFQILCLTFYFKNDVLSVFVIFVVLGLETKKGGCH